MTAVSDLEDRAGHVVHFYDSDAELAAAVVRAAGPRLAAGDVVVLIATGPHRTSFIEGFARWGINVERAQAEGRIVALDAAATAASIVDQGQPDPAAFDAAAGEVIRRAAASGHSVWAFGEMVGLLWDEGHVQGAIDLEELWCDLGRTVPFFLWCAYPSQTVGQSDAVASFGRVCALHSTVVGGPPTPRDAQATQSFPCSPHAVRHARHFVAATLQGWSEADSSDVACLVATEMATNAVTHARSRFTVSLGRLGNAIRITVGDSGPTPPTTRRPDPALPSGRGLHLVNEMSVRWGHIPSAEGKLVWADVMAEPRPVTTDGDPEHKPVSSAPTSQ